MRCRLVFTLARSRSTFETFRTTTNYGQNEGSEVEETEIVTWDQFTQAATVTVC